MNTADLIRRDKLPSADRFLFAMITAVVLHMILLFGLDFKLQFKALNKRSLEVTLVIPTADQLRPDKADVLAQEDQTASGIEGEAEQPRAAPVVQDAQVVRVKPDVKQMDKETKPVMVREKQQRIVTELQSNTKVAPQIIEETTKTEKKFTPEMLAQQISQVSSELTELMARQVSNKRVAYAHTINAHKYQAAAYEKSWKSKIERIGNMNYPESARNGRLSGTLELSVGINTDGSLYRIDVLRSSGHKELDQAAINIVKLAAPYAKLPEGVRDEVEILFIKRRWIFSQNKFSTGSNH
ncbi:MAG: energy transducer TonB [Methylococcales bacterium]